MLVHLPSKRLVLHLANPDRVTTVIPTARAFDFKGHQLVAVPHRIDEVRVLRNLGIQAPSPVEHHYEWPGLHKPFKAQMATSSFLTLNPKAFVLNDMGTGKTLATLWAFDYLRTAGLAKKMLVTCPLSTMERTWGDEIFANFPHLNFAILYGSKERRLKLLAQDADVYIVNHHGMKVIEPELAASDIDTFVIDELGVFRNTSTALWKTAHKIAVGRERVWGLTGTPTPNAPTDAFAQCRIIAPERVPKYFGKFRDMVMRQLGQFKWVPRDSATEIVAEAMQPAVRFTRKDCVDLPPTIPLWRHAQLTAEQNKSYKDMVAKLTMEYQGEQVQAVNEAVKMSKLVQIACGVVYDGTGTEVSLPNDPRIDVVKEIIEEAAAKVIVFVPFKSVIPMVAKALEAEGYTTAQISGDTSKRARDEIFRAFQHDTDPHVLVAQPAAMSHGLTLTAANVVCWYAPITSNDIFEQANARVVRPGQKHTTLIAMIEGTPVERRIYERLQSKQKLQGTLLDMVRAA
jgi:SNF2 family DNA or RNA helicase